MTDISRKDFNAGYLVFILGVIHFLLGLDINIVGISLPSIANYFQTTPNNVSAIVWVYFLIITCFLLFFGKFGDDFGFRKIYLSGIAVFTAGSLFSAISPGLTYLIASRVIQAIGAAVLFALTPAIISADVPDDIKGRAYGINYSFVAIGGVIGRSSSGFLIDYFGWRAIFLINIPVGIFALYVAYKILPESIRRKSDKPFDYFGTLYIFLSLFSLLFIINKIVEFGILSPVILISLAVFIIFVTLFIIRQQNFSNPLFNLSLLKNKNLSIHFLLFLVIYIITNGTIFLFPFFLLSLKVYSAKQIGLMMTVPSVMQMFSGYLSGRLAEKSSPKSIMSIGLAVLFISYIGNTFLEANSSFTLIIILMAVYGFAIGFSIPVNTNAVMKYSSQYNKGSLSSFMTTLVRTGSALGTCLFAAIYNFFMPQSGSTNLIPAFRYTFIFGVIVIFIGLVLLVLLDENEQNPEAD